MRKNILTSVASGCAAAAATFVLAAPASAQFGRRGVTVFADIDFSGGSQVITGDVPDMRALGLNDTISSIHIPNGQVWQICEDINFQGRCQTVSGDLSDLRNGNWNDKISSMRLVNGANRNGRFRDYTGTSGSYGGYNNGGYNNNGYNNTGLMYFNRP